MHCGEKNVVRKERERGGGGEGGERKKRGRKERGKEGLDHFGLFNLKPQGWKRGRKGERN